MTRTTSDNVVNPFLAVETPQSSDAATPSNIPGSIPPSSGAEFEDESIVKLRRVIKAHGVVMGLAFVVLFPLGALLMRIFSFRGLVWVHAATQILTYSLAIAGLGMGIWIADETSMV